MSIQLAPDHKDPTEAPYTQKAIQAAVRKLDLRLIPLVALYYFLSYLDRSNVGNVKVVGFQKDLGLTDHQFSMALTLTAIPYILVEIPSNLILHKVGAGVFIPACVTIWGIVTVCHGFLVNYPGLLAARFFLGLVEGGLYPGILLYLSEFYTRSELQLRIALFYCTSCLSGAFSGLLTYLIIKMDGIQGLHGWCWVFILEGLITIFFGLAGFYLMSSRPDAIKFLSEEEQRILSWRLLKRQDVEIPQAKDRMMYQIWCALKSPHVILLTWVMFFAGGNTYSVSYFQPTVIKSFGYSASDTQLLSIPPYITAFLFMLGAGVFADRYRARGITAIACAMTALTGFVVFYVSSQKLVRYGSLFLSVSGVWGGIPAIGAWLGNNSEPFYRRATSLASGPLAGNVGGLLCIWVFAYADKPHYRIPAIMNIIFVVLIILCCVTNLVWLSHCETQKSKKRDKILEPYGISHEYDDIRKHISSESQDSYLKSWNELGDRHPDFRYSF